MQLVVMATVLALAGAMQTCSLDCNPRNVSIAVESCGKTKFVLTTICEGQCYNKDSVYEVPVDVSKQNVCNGDWSYEVKHFEGCPVAVTYPVAKNCACTTCNHDDTDCGHVLLGHTQLLMSP
ncbi:gonadotropin subunit beta-1 [Nerophis lumbriciformis]|uniref:gonadotropin subunit beta-1 n=1 Tax=Nerophis lumbriciformis TaxID=546530 RepID=UPI002AE03956|nr:follitropin subunit beta [Nerophis lumbriciformis]